MLKYNTIISKIKKIYFNLMIYFLINYKDDKSLSHADLRVKRRRQNKERLLVFIKPIFLTRPFTSKDSQT